MLHSNGLFHDPPASSAEEDATHSVTVKVMKRLLDGDGMKMVSEWENLYQEEADQFCWSMIATTSQFRECIDMLDERGVREGRLLLKLRAMEKDIVKWMKVNGNDDWTPPDEMEVDEEDQTESGRAMRRSTRNKRGAGKKENDMGFIEQLQSSNKDFTSWKNRVKRR